MLRTYSTNMTDEASQYTTIPLTRWSALTSLSVWTFCVKWKLALGQAVKQFYSKYTSVPLFPIN